MAQLPDDAFTCARQRVETASRFSCGTWRATCDRAGGNSRRPMERSRIASGTASSSCPPTRRATGCGIGSRAGAAGSMTGGLSGAHLKCTVLVRAERLHGRAPALIASSSTRRIMLGYICAARAARDLGVDHPARPIRQTTSRCAGSREEARMSQATKGDTATRTETQKLSQ